MKPRVLILGAGFGGLELSTCLSEAMGDGVDITLIDQADAFVLGYSKLDVMFGRETPTDVRCLYTDFIKPGVTFRRETVTAIDAATRTVTTNAGIHTAEALVIALGADYDTSTTPGVVGPPPLSPARGCGPGPPAPGCAAAPWSGGCWRGCGRASRGRRRPP